MTNDKEKYREEFEALAGLDIHTEKWSTGSYKSSIHERSWQCYLTGRKRGEAEVDKVIADVAANCRASYLEELTHLRQQLNNLYFISAGIEVERNHLRQQLEAKSKEIGMSEHRGNTVDFVYDKLEIYKKVIDEKDLKIAHLCQLALEARAIAKELKYYSPSTDDKVWCSKFLEATKDISQGVVK